MIQKFPLNLSLSQPVRWTPWHSLALLFILAAMLLLELLLPLSLRLWAWLGSVGLLLMFGLIAGHGVAGVWLGLLIDSRNKVSLSRLQMTLWTVLILSAFLTAALSNMDEGHPDPLDITIPPELWLLMGITTTALVGSPLIVNLKKAQPVDEEQKAQVLTRLKRWMVDTDQITVQGRMVVNELPEAAGWWDLFAGSETDNAGQLDLSKLQMFFFTIILILAYGSALAGLFGSGADKIEALPALNAGMLALLGISHAGYLAHKALPQPGNNS